MIRRDIIPLARKSERRPKGRAWTFARDPGLLSKLESLVAFERQCCSGLNWTLEVCADTLRLQVEGIHPDASFLALLTGDATGATDARSRKAVRLGAGGMLAGAAAIVACELPLLLGVLGLGAAAFLDAFAVAAIALGGELLGWGLWRRR